MSIRTLFFMWVVLLVGMLAAYGMYVYDGTVFSFIPLIVVGVVMGVGGFVIMKRG